MENGNYNMNTEKTCNANTENEFIDHESKSTENFNKATGLWEFGGRSLHMTLYLPSKYFPSNSVVNLETSYE